MQQSPQQNGVNPAAAGLVGIAIGAAVGSAVTAILSDEKKRTKMVVAFKDLQKRALSTANSFKADSADKAAKVLEDSADKAKRVRRQAI